MFMWQTASWKLKTFLQKKIIGWQDHYGWYTYANWIAENEHNQPPPTGRQRPAQRPAAQPLVSLLISAENSPAADLRALEPALAAQTYNRWEAHLRVASQSGQDTRAAAAELARRDGRFQLLDAQESDRTPDTLRRILETAAGEFILRMDAGDEPAPVLLEEVIQRVEEEPGLDIVFFDEDILSRPGKRRQDPFFKPDWSPELLLSTNYLAHAAFRRSLLEAVFKETPQVRDWEELTFRCTELAEGIGHIPKVLYHARQPASDQPDRLRRVEEHLERLGLKGVQAALQENSQIRLTWPAGEVKVSIIIPTKDKIELLRKCIRSIQACTRYRLYEFIIVDTGSSEAETLETYAQLRSEPEIHLVETSGPFNYSAANNLGARRASGDVFVFLNNDTEAVDPDWLDELVRWVRRPEVGIVGGKLLYPDRSIQHAGIVVGMEGHGSHIFSGVQEGYAGPFGSVEWYRNYTAVTGACMAMRREVYTAIGGFDEAYELVFNDIEICVRAIAKGYRIVYTPFARLIHYEGQTRFRRIPAADIQLGYTHLDSIVERGDPYYNPNLSYAVRIPTFRRKFEEAPIQRLKRIVSLHPTPAIQKRN